MSATRNVIRNLDKEGSHLKVFDLVLLERKTIVICYEIKINNCQRSEVNDNANTYCYGSRCSGK